MRRNNLAPGEYYHIFNRGNHKQNIFFDQRDWIRLLFLILYFRSPLNFYNVGRQISYFVKHRMFNISEDIINEISEKQTVELISFALMPNHFHLILHELNEGGISKYMQRILNAYTKYFNTKHEKVGHLFQGPYKIVHVANNEQLLYLSTYIHRNPRELKDWKNNEHNYPWSSYQDYINKNRWNKLLKNEVIITQFKNNNDYRQFVDKSPAKNYLDDELTIDNDL